MPQASLEDIRMIVGGTTTSGSSRKARKTYLKMARVRPADRVRPKYGSGGQPHSWVLGGRCPLALPPLQ